MRKLFALVLIAMFFSGCNFGKLRDMPGDEAENLGAFDSLSASADPVAKAIEEGCDFCDMDFCGMVEKAPAKCKLAEKLSILHFCPMAIQSLRASVDSSKNAALLVERKDAVLATEKVFSTRMSALSAVPQDLSSAITSESNLIGTSQVSNKTGIMCSQLLGIVDAANCDGKFDSRSLAFMGYVYYAISSCINIGMDCKAVSPDQIKDVFEACENGRIRAFDAPKCPDVIIKDPGDGYIVDPLEPPPVVVPIDLCKNIECQYPKECKEGKCICIKPVDSKDCGYSFDFFYKRVKANSCDEAYEVLLELDAACCVQTEEAFKLYKDVCEKVAMVPPPREIRELPQDIISIDPIEYPREGFSEQDAAAAFEAIRR